MMSRQSEILHSLIFLLSVSFPVPSFSVILEMSVVLVSFLSLKTFSEIILATAFLLNDGTLPLTSLSFLCNIVEQRKFCAFGNYVSGLSLKEDITYDFLDSQFKVSKKFQNETYSTFGS